MLKGMPTIVNSVRCAAAYAPWPKEFANISGIRASGKPVLLAMTSLAM